MTDAGVPLDDAYFEWLYGKVAPVSHRNPRYSYWKLLKQLYTKQFQWFVPNDDNRVEDGKELRLHFLDDTGYILDDPYQLFLELDCSMLEMLIAFASRVAAEAETTLDEWFWRFLHNLELDRYSDDLYEISIQEEVEETLDRVNRRTYAPDGTGGLFPLRHSTHDQRKIELWYQMSSYLLEGLYVYVRPRF